MKMLLLLLMLKTIHCLNPGTLDRQKRFIDYVGAFKTMFDEFPKMINGLEDNAQIRLAAESGNIKPIQYAHQGPAHSDPYQTNFNEGGFNPGDLNLYKDSDKEQLLYMSMTTTPRQPDGSIVNEKLTHSIHQDQYTPSPKLYKRSAQVKNLDPRQRSFLLGNEQQTITHYSEVKSKSDDSSQETSVVGIPNKFRKRSIKAKDSSDDIAIDDLKLAEAIMSESTSKEEALIKMFDAEEKVDKALHKVLGNMHQNDDKDIKDLQQILVASGVPTDIIAKRSIDASIENMIKESNKKMKSANKMLEEEDHLSKSLEEVLQADKSLTKLLEKILPSHKIEEHVNTRTKRDHGTSYYDPEFLWLLNNLELNSREGEQTKKVIYGESSLEPWSSASVYRSQPTYSSGGNVYYTNQDRQNKMEEKSTWHSILDSLRPVADAVPVEFNAAYAGALDVGKHVTKKVKPYVYQGYDKVTNEYIPKVGATLSGAVNEDIKDFARQGKKIVESRARYASKVADPHLANLKNDLWLLQRQINQIAEETSEYTKKEVLPNIGPTIRGLLFDAQETLELASSIVESDVKPLIDKVSDSVIRPAYSTVSSSVISPAASTVNDYVVRPVADYVVDPVVRTAVPVAEYAKPVYQSAHTLASSGIDGARVTLSNVKPKIQELSSSTQKVLNENVAPSVKVAASHVAVGASKLGQVIQSDVVPTVQQGLSTTLNGLFTGIPSLVSKVSSEASDAANIFSNRYKYQLQQLKAKAEKERKEQELKLNMIEKEISWLQKDGKAMLNAVKTKKKLESNVAFKDGVDPKSSLMKKFDAVLDAIVEEPEATVEDENTDNIPNQTDSPETIQTTTPKEL